MGKRFTLVFVLVLASSSLIMVKPEFALAQVTTPTPIPQASPSSSPTSSPTPTPTPSIPTPTPFIPKPAVPEFTVKLNNSLAEANETRIELTIKNQPFDVNNAYHYSFVYNVRISTDCENWTDLYDAEDGYPYQSNSDYTVLSYVLGEIAYYPREDYPLAPSTKVGVLPTSGQVDFQVEAMIGYRKRSWEFIGGQMLPYVFEGERSGWSNTQTLTIPDSSTPSPSPASSIEPTQSTEPQQTEPFPKLPIVTASIAIVAVVAVSVLFYFKKRRRTLNSGEVNI
jgi:hypothetical protein